MAAHAAPLGAVDTMWSHACTHQGAQAASLSGTRCDQSLAGVDGRREQSRYSCAAIRDNAPSNAKHHGPSERCDGTVRRVIAARPRTRPDVFVLGRSPAVSAVAAHSAWCGLEKVYPGDIGRAPMRVLVHVLQGPMQARSLIAARDSGPRPGVNNAG